MILYTKKKKNSETQILCTRWIINWYNN